MLGRRRAGSSEACIACARSGVAGTPFQRVLHTGRESKIRGVCLVMRIRREGYQPSTRDRALLSLASDGGFRRGTDVIKALSLGANAAMTGRATLYGLAANGERGVERALEILTTEMERAMGQLGVNSVADLGPHIIRRS